MLTLGAAYELLIRFDDALWGVERRSCAAVAGGSSRVAASGGQGGIGGLRVPPTPSLDSLLTPLYRRRSAMGLEAARRGVLTQRSALLQMGGCGALRSCVALRVLGRRSCVLLSGMEERPHCLGGRAGHALGLQQFVHRRGAQALHAADVLEQRLLALFAYARD